MDKNPIQNFLPEFVLKGLKKGIAESRSMITARIPNSRRSYRTPIQNVAGTFLEMPFRCPEVNNRNTLSPLITIKYTRTVSNIQRSFLCIWFLNCSYHQRQL